MTSQEKSFVNEPWYETLRIILEGYEPAPTPADADETHSSAEIIQMIETHHGTPQGVVGKKIFQLMDPDDFVTAMRRFGYREHASGLEVEWLMKKK